MFDFLLIKFFKIVFKVDEKDEFYKYLFFILNKFVE